MEHLAMCTKFHDQAATSIFILYYFIYFCIIFLQL